MRIRSHKTPLEPFDAGIEATAKRRREKRAKEPDQHLLETMVDSKDQATLITEFQRQLQAINIRMKNEAAERQRAIGAPVRDQFANVTIPRPPIRPRIEANQFELKTGLIQMVRDIPFARRSVEDANKHLTNFLQIASTIKYNGVSDDAVKMRLFSFSLVDDVRDWYNSLEPNSVRTWNDMATQFLEKLFPLRTTLKLQVEITQLKLEIKRR